MAKKVNAVKAETAKSMLSTIALDKIRQWSSENGKANRTKVAMLDVMFADGLRATHLRVYLEGKKDSNGKQVPNPEFRKGERDIVKAHLENGLPAADQALLKKDAKSLSDVQKVRKAAAIREVGSLIKDIMNSLKRREATESESESKSESKSTLESRIKRDIAKYVAQLEKVESFKGDVVSLLKALRSAQAYIKG